MAVIVIAGRFTKDAEIRQTQDGKIFARFGIAENVYRNGGQEAQFFDCQLWGQRAEKLAPYITKGGAATVFGTLQLREYTAQNGEKRTALDVSVNDITLQGNAAANGQPVQQRERQNPPPYPPLRQHPTAPTPQDDIDDDVPF